MARYVAWLNPDEAKRYAKFVRPQRQRQFLLGRALLRRALGSLLGVEAEAVPLVERPGQAPLLSGPLLRGPLLNDPLGHGPLGHGPLPHGPNSAPGFSLSHSGPWIACAVSPHMALGLDIEVRDPARNPLDLGEQAFEADDVAWLRACAGKMQSAVFHDLWSLKEARVKLASTRDADAGEGECCMTLPHPDLSVVLCCALPLARLCVAHGDGVDIGQALPRFPA